jgi:hypothetical protein
MNDSKEFKNIEVSVSVALFILFDKFKHIEK